MSVTPLGTSHVHRLPGRSLAAQEGRHCSELKACARFRRVTAGGPGTSTWRATREEGSQDAACQPLPHSAPDAPKCFCPSLQHI